MANFYNTTFTPTATGITTITCGFQPVEMEVWVSSKVTATGDSFAHGSNGTVDNTGFMSHHSFFYDASGGNTRRSTAKLVGVLERVSGTITEVNTATFDSFTATSAKINTTLLTSQYQYNARIRG